jgi:hypothetical protein
MSTPFRTFTESVTLMSLSLAAKLQTTTIGSLFNFAHRQLVSSTQWVSRQTDTLVITVDPYTTGTVTATQGSATVVGVGTTFTSAMVNRMIRIGGSNGDAQFYRISAFTDATHITIEKSYATPTQTAAGFEIFGLRYPLPTNCRTPALYLSGNTNPMPQRDNAYIQFADPNRYIVDSAPLYWSLFGVDDDSTSSTYGAQFIEFWPRFSAAAAVRLQYYKEADDLSGNQRPILRSDLVEYLALSMCCMALHNEFGDPHWKVSADKYDEKFTALYEIETREDLQRHGAPDQINWHHPVTRGAQYVATHDVAW